MSAHSVVALIDEGNALEEQGRPDQAMERYEAAVRADPNCARAHLNRGNILFASAAIDAAREAYEQAVACDPQYAAAHFNLANLNCRAGEYAAALRQYADAVRLKPDFADAFVALGNALVDLGRPAEAVESYQRALAINPRLVVTGLFEDYAARFDTHLVAALDYSAPQAMRAAVDRLTHTNRRFHHALDLGCGTGLIGTHFEDVVTAIDGVDLSPRMLAEARKKQIYARLDCEELVSWLKRAAAESLSFDLVLSADVFIYVGDLEPVFKAIRTILAADGLFVFSVERLEEGSFELLPTFRYAHSTSYVREIASRHGFAIELCEPIDLRKEGDVMIEGTIFVLKPIGKTP